MALIVCPECNKSISEYSNACIYCGCPMNKIKELIASTTDDYEEKADNINLVVEKQTDAEIEIFDLKGMIPEKDRLILSMWIDTGAVLQFKNQLGIITQDAYDSYFEERYSDSAYSDEVLDELYDKEMLFRNRKALEKYGLSDEVIKKLINKWKTKYWWIDDEDDE